MSWYQPALVVAVGVLLGSTVCGAEELKLADTSEKLTAAEEKAVRRVVSEKGLATASRDIVKMPYPRVLCVYKELQVVYDAKPKATVRLLLKIVEGGSASDSYKAVAYINALVHSPEFGALASYADVKTWDDADTGPIKTTRREDSRRVCVKLIAEKETPKMVPPTPIP